MKKRQKKHDFSTFIKGTCVFGVAFSHGMSIVNILLVLTNITPQYAVKILRNINISAAKCLLFNSHIYHIV